MNIKFMPQFWTVFSAALITLLVIGSGCNNPGGDYTDEEGDIGETEASTSAQDENGDAVCNPLDGVGSDPQHGLYGDLYYKTDSSVAFYQHVEDYFLLGDKAAVSIFFGNLNVPTRPFDSGFVTNDGTIVQNPDGSTMYENFALRLGSRLKLGANDPEGYYQIALLTDDGTRLYLNQGDGSGEHLFINNNHVTPTQWSCPGTDADASAIGMNGYIHLMQGQSIDMTLEYFQGPKFHIALVMMWRWVSDAHALANHANSYVACNAAGNDVFYFGSTSSEVTPMFQGFLNSEANAPGVGPWHVLNNENFLLPDAAPSNPCNQCTGFGCGGGGIGV